MKRTSLIEVLVSFFALLTILIFWYLKIVQPILALLLTMITLVSFITVKGIERKKWWSRKRKINYALITAWLVFLMITGTVPDNTYGALVYSISTPRLNIPYTFEATPAPPVSFTATWSMSTVGVFSEYNPINFTLILLNVNISKTNFLHYYGCMAFTNGTSPIRAGNNPYCFTPISAGNQTAYSTNGSVEFDESGPNWFFLYPTPPSPNARLQVNTAVFNQLFSQAPFLVVGPQSDTLALQLNEFATKLAFVLGSFSILLLQPLIEGVLLPRKEH